MTDIDWPKPGTATTRSHLIGVVDARLEAAARYGLRQEVIEGLKRLRVRVQELPAEGVESLAQQAIWEEYAPR